MIARFIYQTILKSPKSVLILGPRQCGKTTLIEQVKADLSINLADEEEFQVFIKNKDELKSRIDFVKAKTVYIDEIQRIPSLLNTIQVIVDANKDKIKFYLTGSSARKLRRGSANLLPGRLFNYRLGPLSLLDLDFKLDVIKALEHGCLPEPYLNNKKNISEKILQSYTAIYLREEIMIEALVRDLHGFGQFINVVAENSGHFLDFSKIANKARVNRSAARRYYEILEDTLICDRLDSYFDPENEELNKKLVKHSKFYLFDVGIKNGILQNYKASNDRIGLLFEHLFYNQIKNCSYSLDKDIKISHFRTLLGAEIDFIVNINNKNYAIELKATEPSLDEIKKIEKINNEFNLNAELYIACIKCKPKKVGHVKIVDWVDLIKKLVSKLY